MPAPSYCTISGVCYQESPTATSGTPILAPKGRLHVTPVSVTDNIIWEHTQTVQADPTTALITFNAVQGSTIHIQGSVMGWVAGDNVLVPSSSTSTLEALTSVATVPVAGLTIQEEGVSLVGLFGTVNFIGGGISAVRVSAGVASVTVSATGTYQLLDADLTAIAALAGTSGLLRKTAADTWSLDTTSFPAAANPSALVGLSAVNGVATTFLRSDGAPALDVGIVPTWTGNHIFSKNGALSLPTASLTGSWITGGSATTTKPHVLIEPTGATSTAWSTAGTALGINAASGFAGKLLDLQVNGVTKFNFDAVGGGTATLGSTAISNVFQSSLGFQITAFGAYYGVSGGSRFVVNNGNIQALGAQLALLRQTATGVVATTNFNWNSGNIMEFTFGAGNETITFSNLLSGSPYTIAMIQDTVSGPRVATWPSTVKWVGGAAPTLSNGNGKRDVFTFYSNGTNIYEISRALDVR